jgi:hypothetical protein
MDVSEIIPWVVGIGLGFVILFLVIRESVKAALWDHQERLDEREVAKGAAPKPE